MKVTSVLPIALLLGLLYASPTSASPNPIPVGVATTDVTPDKPIRLSGYARRDSPSEGVDQPLHAKALAIGSGSRDEPLSVLVTVDVIAIPDWISTEVARRIGKKWDVAREQIVVAATHTHSGPALRDKSPYILTNLSKGEAAEISRYSDLLVDKLEKVALQAIDDREPCYLSWGKGKLTFAKNRRVLENGKWKGFGAQKDGPVDPSMPLLRITNKAGENVAVFVNYACHCTTLSGEYNRIHGDWAGEARTEIEKRHPGMTAMIAIGCGADQGPQPTGSMEAVIAHGSLVADEVDRMLGEVLLPLSEAPSGIYNEIELPLDDLPPRAAWEEHVKKKTRYQHFAKDLIEKLDRGEEIATSVKYPVQTWTFGDDLAMVFLGGEVVVDYALRLYRELDSERVWLNAYSNDNPGYLVSRRLYGEGGYEVDGSRLFYGLPARFRSDTEDRICDEVVRQIPQEFYSAATLEIMPLPLANNEILDSITVADGYEVQLVANEPQTMDPVDIAWDAQGRMWVVEMADYPLGIEGKLGGRIRILQDTDLDGYYETSSLFLDGLRYPNSIFPWRDGVIFVTADSIRFASDTDDDGRANENIALFTGFESGNSQHQLGSLQWGLDNWIHVGNGDSKGELISQKTGESVKLGARDVRFDPDTGKVEALSGKAQFGITRDDWGNWFGCNNSRPWWHYALDDRYLARNPHVSSPDPKVLLTDEPIAGPVFPTSRTVARFNDPGKKSRFTSACGLWFSEGLLYVAEPVHNLVSRIKIEPRETTFTGARLPSETSAEFFTSTDNWCRPTSIRTGPGGAIYIVDMVRQIIEHPKWIPDETERRLTLRNGHDRGRIFRIIKKGQPHRVPPPLESLSGVELADALESPTNTRRNLAHLELLWREDPEAIQRVMVLAAEAQAATTRIHALSVLERKKSLTKQQIREALADSHPAVRRLAVRLAEPFLRESDPELTSAVVALCDDDDAFVRQQLAYSLGESPDIRAGLALATLAAGEDKDRFLEAALLSSAAPHLVAMMESEAASRFSARIIDGLFQTAIGSGNDAAIVAIFDTLPANFDSLRRVSGPLQKAGLSFDEIVGAEKFLNLLKHAGERAIDTEVHPEERVAAIRVLGRNDTHLLLSLLDARHATEIQSVAIQRGAQIGAREFAVGILENWNGLGAQSRDTAIDAILGRGEWTRLFLEAAGENPALVKSLDATQRAALHNHRDKSIRGLSATIFGQSSSSRAEAMAKFESSLELKPNLDSGKLLFASLCASCHKIAQTGFHVGPDLTALSDLSRPSLLSAIVDPQAAVESKYAVYTAETTGGQSVTGVMASETASSITLLGPGGIEQTVLRSQLASLNSPGISFMPEGLEAALDPQKMADLLGYLQAVGSANPESKR